MPRKFRLSQKKQSKPVTPVDCEVPRGISFLFMQASSATPSAETASSADYSEPVAGPSSESLHSMCTTGSGGTASPTAPSSESTLGSTLIPADSLEPVAGPSSGSLFSAPSTASTASPSAF